LCFFKQFLKDTNEFKFEKIGTPVAEFELDSTLFSVQIAELESLLTHLTQKGSCQKSIKRGRMQNKPREGEKKWIKSFWICTAITSSPHFH
jgi:hypothetical protein